ncbi:MAG: glycosyltransferase, partial [Lachnospiraceae bacterium]|nr:glycosyltransferase [Lachnospiraceae bacterium]
SVISQTFTDFEILLVDDGATDGSGALCDELAQCDGRIRVVHKENGGLSDARNAGIRASRGRYIGLVDSDDYIAPDMYETLYRNLEKEHADVSVCTHYSCYQDSIEASPATGYEVLTGIEMIGRCLEGNGWLIFAWNKLYRRDLLLETPFTKGRLYEDSLIMGELFSKVDRVVVDYTPKYYYVHHKGTITSQDYSSKYLDIIYGFERNFEVVQQTCPQYLDLAWYRRLRAHYEVMDRIAASDSEDAKRDKAAVKGFLRRNYWRLLRCPYIVPTRKMITTLLFLCEPLYRSLIRRKQGRKRYV